MDLQFDDKFSMKDFILQDREAFEERLLNEAINVKDRIDKIHRIGNINLVHNAHKLVLYVVEEQEEDLISFAKQEGVAWAKYSLTLAFKLEWIQAIRRTLWDFLYQYELLTNREGDIKKFFIMEKNINELIDLFHTHFFINYTKFKDELLDNQRKLVENLSVPIIPINKEICVLPLIGTIDDLRVITIQEKVLSEVEQKRIQILIIDLSGVAQMDEGIANNFIKIIKGITMMGCKTVLTGIRTEIVKSLISSGIEFDHHAEFKGTLQLALDDVLFKDYIS